MLSHPGTGIIYASEVTAPMVMKVCVIQGAWTYKHPKSTLKLNDLYHLLTYLTYLNVPYLSYPLPTPTLPTIYFHISVININNFCLLSFAMLLVGTTCLCNSLLLSAP